MSEEFKAILNLVQNTTGSVQMLVIVYFIKGFITSLLGYGVLFTVFISTYRLFRKIVDGLHWGTRISQLLGYKGYPGERMKEQKVYIEESLREFVKWRNSK